MLVVIVLLHRLFLSFASRRNSELGLVVLLYGGREFIKMGEQGGDLPRVLFAQGFFPGGHAGVAHSGADGVEELALLIVGRIGYEVRSGRIKRLGEGVEVTGQAPPGE